MKKRIILFAMAMCMLLAGASAQPKAFAQSEDALHPCELYTRADVNALFESSVSAGRVREAKFPAGEICEYALMNRGGTLGLKIRISTNAAIREEDAHGSALDVFTKQKSASASHGDAAKKFKAIQGLGDEAFWSGADLWVLKGDALVVITANSALKGSAKDREAIENARSEQNLALSQKVAETMLSRMKQEEPEQAGEGEAVIEAGQ